jgi:hypothetical protein
VCCSLQCRAPPFGYLLRPAVHGLPMHANAARHFRLGYPLLQQPRSTHASSLQLHPILFDSGWMSHARKSTRENVSCH